MLVTESVPGVVLEDLHLAIDGGGHGISLVKASAGPGPSFVLVRNCTIEGGADGIQVIALMLDENSAMPGPSP